MGIKSIVTTVLFLLIAASADAQTRYQSLRNDAFLDEFAAHNGDIWWRTDHRKGGKKINDTGFRAHNIDVGGGALSLTLTGAPYQDRGHTGASYKTRGLYHYGRYDAIMKAARGSGIVSAFYTYTGPAYGMPHDEIDFEFLGRDGRLVHLNYYVEGTARLRRTIDLDFDSSEQFHLYTIEWKADEIAWFVDGALVHRATAKNGPLPSNPGKIIADIWAAKGLDKWAGPLDRSALPANAFLRCVSFKPIGDNSPSCADRFAQMDQSSAPAHIHRRQK